MTTLLKTQGRIFVLSAVSIFIAYFWLDKPIVFWAHQHQVREYATLISLTHIPEILSGLILLSFPYWIFRFHSHHHTYMDRTAFVLTQAAGITAYFTAMLKIVFSRYWPATWVNNNLSLLNNNAYGFNWFHGGVGYASFPSGHTAMTVAIAVTIAMLYPRLKWVMSALVLVVVLPLITVYYHFLSDALAGALLGYLIASNTVHMSGVLGKQSCFK